MRIVHQEENIYEQILNVVKPSLHTSSYFKTFSVKSFILKHLKDSLSSY